MSALVLLLEALAVVVIGGTWMWRRWGRWQSWIVVGPPALALALLITTNVSLLFPNLL
jgi:sortase A